MKKIFILSIIILLHSSLIFSQVAINENGTPPDPSAGLDVNFTNRGFLLPRLTFEQRNAIQNPAEGLIIYCIDCSANATGALSIYQGGLWRLFNLDCDAPNAPSVGSQAPSVTQIVWKWHPVPIAIGYKWNTTNVFYNAYDLGTDTTFTETGLTCWTPYTRYVWAYNSCGQSVELTLTDTTLQIPFSPAPTENGTSENSTMIAWTWNYIPAATGYLWSATNDPNTAYDLGNTYNFYLETGLNCNTSYTRYVWAYNDCGISPSTTMTHSTWSTPPTAPASGIHVPSPAQIVWKWRQTGNTQGYKWNTTNDYNTATDMGADTTKTETGLSCNSFYNRYVWSYNNCGHSTSTTISQSTSLDPPSAPVTATHYPSSNQIVWNWNAVTGATGYRWNTINDSINATDVGNVTTHTETGLPCNTSQTSYVWTYNSCGVSVSTSLTQSTSLNPPAAPVAATHVPSLNQIVWNWNAVTGATGYRWNTTNDSINATDIGNVTSHTETGLTCNTLQTSFVWAYSNCGVSISTTMTKATSANPPATPVAANHVPSLNQIVWNWNAVTGATGYRWSTINDSINATDIGNVTTKTETGLTCNTLQTSYVWAYGECGVSASTTLTKATLADPPAAPVAATHTPSSNQIVWNWNAVTGATGYRWNTTNDSINATDIGNITTQTETGLACNTLQESFVWAYGACGVSISTSLSETTSLDPPVAPVAATHTPSSGQIIWNWNAVTGATGYRWNSTNDSVNATDIGNNTSHTQSGLACNTPYSSYVWAYSSCGVSTSTTLTQSTTTAPPTAPVAAAHVPSPTQIVWNWNAVAGATGYRWNTANDSVNATDIGNVTSHTETGLACNSDQISYVWAYSDCGVSTKTTLTQATSTDPPAVPVAATHVVTYTQITWKWNTVSGATGYKWSTANNYSGATEMGTDTLKTETSLTCGTSYTRYAWAYNSCGHSTQLTLTQATTDCWTCGSNITIVHVADTVAPVDKTTTYGTVNNIPGETTKCWITSNLGSDHQATGKDDATEPSAGWYWQYNRSQGYKHDGTTRTPSSAWIIGISEPDQWLASHDPCIHELGDGWRLPTYNEWNNVDIATGWSNWDDTWNSALKLHAAGGLSSGGGSLQSRGLIGNYWSSSSVENTKGRYLNFLSSFCNMSAINKSAGFPVRCIRTM